MKQMVRKTCKHLFALKFKPCMLYQATDVGLSITCMCFQGYVINSVIIYSIFIEVYLFFFPFVCNLNEQWVNMYSIASDAKPAGKKNLQPTNTRPCVVFVTKWSICDHFLVVTWSGSTCKLSWVAKNLGRINWRMRKVHVIIFSQVLVSCGGDRLCANRVKSTSTSVESTEVCCKLEEGGRLLPHYMYFTRLDF